MEAEDAPNSSTYQMLSGAPVKEYLGTVNVIAQDGATSIHWGVKLKLKIPGIVCCNGYKKSNYSIY